MPTSQDLANAIRFLSIDAVQRANSGHPGMPMGMATIATVLSREFLKHNPKNPNWSNRDRFILSNGHGAMLHYALLHLSGYDLSINDIKAFRQLHSKTPGHPEYGDTPGIETTTGPLGQGLANGVGMAISEKHLGEQFNRENIQIVDHYTYVFVGDGCLMEGISHEACSLAGTLGLGKLIVFYDDNGVSIDGEVSDWFTDDTAKRFEAYHWQVIPNVDGHDESAVRTAITQAKANTLQPTLIACKTHIGFGAPNKQDTASAHGSPLGIDEIAKTREVLGWSYAPFEIPNAIYEAWDATATGAEAEKIWQTQCDTYQQQYPDLFKEFQRRLLKQLPDNWSDTVAQFIETQQNTVKNLATRKSSEICLDAYGAWLPEMLGGSADLTGSNNTWQKQSTTLSKSHFKGNYIHYGVREFGMFAIMNGIALHGGCIPYGGTFLTFIDYGRNAIRLASLMKQRVIFVLTHDSIGLGEDGPTHQPIEHASILRTTPGVSVWRPCDTVETAVAWQFAIEHQKPSCLLLTRQATKHQARTPDMLKKIKRGGYILKEPQDSPEAIIIATGSEVELATKAAEQLQANGHPVRVVSMPSTTEFDAQDKAYKATVLPEHIKARVAIEASTADFWYKYVGIDGEIIGLHDFGASAPCEDLYKYFNLTVEHLVETTKKLINNTLETRHG